MPVEGPGLDRWGGWVRIPRSTRKHVVPIHSALGVTGFRAEPETERASSDSEQRFRSRVGPAPALFPWRPEKPLRAQPHPIPGRAWGSQLLREKLRLQPAAHASREVALGSVTAQWIANQLGTETLREHCALALPQHRCHQVELSHRPWRAVGGDKKRPLPPGPQPASSSLTQARLLSFVLTADTIPRVCSGLGPTPGRASSPHATPWALTSRLTVLPSF